MRAILEWYAVVGGFVALIAWYVACMAAAAFLVDRMPGPREIVNILALVATFSGLAFALVSARAASRKL